MNRALTTIVQLMLAGVTIILLRMMWQDLKNDLQEIKNDLFNRK
jgi:hypothetical protein